MKNQEEKWLLEEKYAGEKNDAFFADVAALRNGTPLAYLIGSIPFLDCTIHLDSHPLIPRSETEFWTEKAIAELKKKENPKVLDLCAGSGAIGIAVAKAVPGAHVTLGEIDPAHLPTIGKNLEANGINCTQYSVFESDLFAHIDGVFDYIVTNPPYIDPAIDRAEVSVKMHEPHLALYGGSKGMECIEKIIAQAAGHLTKEGQLWIEHEPEQVTAIAACAAVNNFTALAHNDQYNTARYSVLTHSVAK